MSFIAAHAVAAKECTAAKEAEATCEREEQERRALLEVEARLIDYEEKVYENYTSALEGEHKEEEQ